MKTRLLFIVLSLVSLAAFARAADQEKEEPKQASEQEIRARLAEHARKKLTHAVADTPAPASTTATAPTDPAAPGKPAGASPDKPEVAKTDPAKTEKPVEEPAKVLPTVEVTKSRITELDKQLEKQNKEIAREKQNAKPTKLDETLNGPGVSKALSIFGGQSSSDRANIAKERVAMMEDEKDLMEAIAQTQDKEEKAELEKTLVSLRAMRRDLENALR